MKTPRPLWSRRRPKRFVAWFGVYISALSVAGAAAVDQVVAFRFPHAAKLAAEYAKLSGPTVVAVGSSRTEAIFDVNRMTAYLRRTVPHRPLTAFCAFAHHGGPVPFEAIVDAVVRAGPKPDLLIVETGVEFFDEYNGWLKVGRDLTWRNAPEVIPDLLTPQSNRFAEEKSTARIVENRLLPVYARRFEVRLAVWRWAHALLGREAPKLDPLEPNVDHIVAGYTPSKPEVPVLTEKVRTLQETHATPLRRFHGTGSAAKALARTLQNCEAHGVPVVMFEVPVSSPLFRALDPPRPQYRDFVAGLRRRFRTMRYYDCHDALPDCAFSDDLHVNLYGRDVMCRRLSEMIIPDALASLGRADEGPVAAASPIATVK